MTDFVFRVGGEAGKGIATVAKLFSNISMQLGFNIFWSKEYASQIKGGHNYHTVRISDKKVEANINKVDLLIALDKRTLQTHLEVVKEKGIIICNHKDLPDKKENLTFLTIDLEKINLNNKEKLINFIFLGAALKALEVDPKIIEQTITSELKKSKEMQKSFVNATLEGYNLVEKVYDLKSNPSNKNEQLISGNTAIVQGALKAGLTFHVQYPMTPVTGILHDLSKESTTNKNLTVIQPEDEIAAINMALGASFTGARSMTATSGGGFALMVESLGLAGMAEIPLVIIEGQRPGPATGLPTKTEQGDLKFVINAGTGDFPLAVIAPSTIEECYTETKRAFYLAEKYQLPVIILVDKHLTEGFVNINLEKEEANYNFNYNQKMNVLKTVKDNQLNEDGLFKRYASKENNRTLPGTENGIYTCAGDEHDEVGGITEDATVRIEMVKRRAAKEELILKDLPSLELIGPENAPLTVVSWGSNFAAIAEGIEILSKEDKKVNFLNLKYMLPFQKEEVKSILSNSKKLLLVENNATAQLGQLIAEQTGILIENKILKCDGQTFTTNEIYEEIKRWLS